MSSDIRLSPFPLAGKGEGEEGAAAPRPHVPAPTGVEEGQLVPDHQSPLTDHINDVAIRVSNLSKCYQIYDRPEDRLKQSVVPRLQRLMHKPVQNYFREFWALRDVSFEVKKGQTVGIVGRNGSGKSTLLQIICGTLTPTSGTIETNGRIAALLELGSGFNPEFTGRENVYMNCAVLGLSAEEIDSSFDDIAAFADIGDFINQPVKTYSSGMYTRLAFAVAINVKPDVLVVDEALAVGDEAFQRKCFARINEIKRAGAAILFVSHAPNTIIQLCDRAILMDGGRGLLDGTPKLIVSLYQKMLYAGSEENKVRAQIRTLSAVATSQMSAVRIAKESESIVTHSDTNPAMALQLEDAEYDPGLISKSKVAYQSQGARICDVHIQDMEGRKVNVLVHGHRYRYCYRVDFYERSRKVGFGMALKTVTGVEISGQASHGMSEGLEEIEAGQIVEVEFEFLNLLLPGTYFTNAGVASHQDGSVLFLHRVTDAMVFRVKHFDADQPVSCLVNLRPSGTRVRCRVSDPQPDLRTLQE